MIYNKSLAIRQEKPRYFSVNIRQSFANQYHADCVWQFKRKGLFSIIGDEWLFLSIFIKLFVVPKCVKNNYKFSFPQNQNASFDLF